MEPHDSAIEATAGSVTKAHPETSNSCKELHTGVWRNDRRPIDVILEQWAIRRLFRVVDGEVEYDDDDDKEEEEIEIEIRHDMEEGDRDREIFLVLGREQ